MFGRHNPIVRASKCMRMLLDDYDPKEMFMPNTTTLPNNEKERPEKIFKVGRTDGSECSYPEYPSKYGDMGSHKFSSGTVFDDRSRKTPLPSNFGSLLIAIDDNLKLLSTAQKERNLLSKLGNFISPTDEVLVMKTNTGEVKGAIAISRDATNKIKCIKYVDVDKDSSNFNKSITKLAMKNIGGTVIYHEDVDVVKYPIPSKYVVE